MPPEPAHIVYYLPGMAGMLHRDRLFCDAIRKAGIKLVHDLNWVRHPWTLQLLNLRQRRGHLETAEQVARMIDTEPDFHRVVLIGHSTGAMIALDILEHLQQRTVEQTWLLAPAVSRSRDITAALPHTDRLLNLYSGGDWLHNCIGTSLVGSADGKFGPCAGYAPLTGPGSDDDTLKQVNYDQTWRQHGHRGGHLSILKPDFATHVIVPAIQRGGQL